MRYLILPFLLFLACSNSLKGQITGNDFFKVVDLYIDGQYEVVVYKLSNNGFSLKKVTPDHNINQIDYKGDMEMHQIFNCPNNLPAGNNYTLPPGFVIFKTESSTSENYIQIRFDVYLQLAEAVFMSTIEEWQREFGNYKYPSDDLLSRKSASIQDTNTYYYVNPANSSSLLSDNRRANLSLEYYASKPNTLCYLGYTRLKGDLSYRIPKFLVDNPDEFFTNVTNNKTIITVPVKKQANTYLVEVTIGGKNLIYLIDSGASEMFISKSTEKYLLELGIIRNSDYLPAKTFTLADNSTRTYRRVMLPVVKIGPIKVDNVEAAITDDGGPLLLGKSFLDRLKYWKINNINQTLELEK